MRQAGGFIIQLMPEAEEDVIAGLEKRLGEIRSVTALLDAGEGPEELLSHVLGDFGLEILDRIPTRFFCDCSKERVKKALISVGKKELEDMIASGEEAEVSCHFCNERYRFEVPELEEILEILENQTSDK